MANNPNHKKNLVPFKKGQSGNPKGRPKGRKNISTVIQELEEEEFDWSLFPQHTKQLQEFVDLAVPIGTPFRAIVYRAVVDAIAGKPIEKIAAREWLRKAGYGDKIDLTSKGKRIMQQPIFVPNIKPREAVNPQGTDDSVPSDETGDEQSETPEEPETK